MPAIIGANSDFTPKTSGHIPWQQHLLAHSSIYIVTVTSVGTFLFLVLRFASTRLVTRQECRKDYRQQDSFARVAGGFLPEEWAGSHETAAGVNKSVSWVQPGQGQGTHEKEATFLWLVSAQPARRSTSSTAAAAGFGGSQGSAMEEKDAAGSRGVSRGLTTSAADQSDPKKLPSLSFPAQQGPYHNAATISTTLPSYSPRRSVDGPGPEETGKGQSMDDECSWASSGIAGGSAMAASATTSAHFLGTMDDQYVSYADANVPFVPTSTEPATKSSRSSGRHFDLPAFTRSPQPPFLTSPMPDTDSSFTTQYHASFGNSRWPPPPTAAYADSLTIPAELDAHTMNASSASYIDIHQPNPNYHTAPDASPSSGVEADSGKALASAAMAGTAYYSSPTWASGVPTRGSYTKSIRIPTMPGLGHSGSSSGHSITTSRPSDSFHSYSYPLSSPFLPPPSPDQYYGFVEEPEVMVDDGHAADIRFGHGHMTADNGHDGQIEMHGETVSAVDNHGAGWKRHTRVYGGGVCLACAASGGEGGFYGKSVRPEDKFQR